MPETIIATFERPCDPTAMRYMLKDGDRSETKYNANRSTINTLLLCKNPKVEKVAAACLNHPDVGRLLAGEGLAHDNAKTYKLICNRIQDDPVFHRMVVDSAARFNPHILEWPDEYCDQFKEADASWRDPEAVHTTNSDVKLAQAERRPMDEESESTLDDVAVPDTEVQPVIPPAYGTVMNRYYIPNTGPELRIPSRFKGGRRRSATRWRGRATSRQGRATSHGRHHYARTQGKYRRRYQRRGTRRA